MVKPIPPLVRFLSGLRSCRGTGLVIMVDFIRAFSEETYGVPRENVVGNSLEYGYGADGRLTRLVNLGKYDDAQREWAYDRESRVGRLSEALDEPIARGWTAVSMKADWNRVFRHTEPV